MQLIRAAVKFLETDTVWYEMGHRGEVVWAPWGWGKKGKVSVVTR